MKKMERLLVLGLRLACVMLGGLFLFGCIPTLNGGYNPPPNPVAEFTQRVRDAIDYWNPTTRDFAKSLINPANEGRYNIAQICDIWDYCSKRVCGGHWVYVSDPVTTSGELFNPTPASETIEAWAMTGDLRGDCDDYAVLNAALIRAIGGGTRFIVASKGDMSHAYAEVFLSDSEEHAQNLASYIAARYRINWVNWWVDEDGEIWLNLDWQECHPGGRFYEGQRVLVIYPYSTPPASMQAPLASEW